MNKEDRKYNYDKLIAGDIEALKNRLATKDKPVKEFYVEYIQDTGLPYRDFLRYLNFHETITADMEPGIDEYMRKTNV